MTKFFDVYDNISQIASSFVSAEEILKNFVGLLESFLNIGQSSVIIFNSKTWEFSPDLCKDFIVKEDGKHYYKPESDIIRILLKNKKSSGKPLISYQPADNKGILFLMFEIERDIFGLINLKNHGDQPFDANQLKAICALAQHMVFNINHMRLKLESSNNILNFLKSLAMAIDARDHYTRLHSVCVTKYAVMIGETMGLSKHDLELLSHGSLLHDIGKIGIPDNILLKQGKLTEEEVTQLRKHPQIGARILGDDGPFKDIVPLVLYHHEYYDGSGYPYGLKGEEIPLGARIIAVADAFEAMTSNRPYRQRYSVVKAKEELLKGMGSQFDPTIVKAFIKVLKEFES